LTGGHAEMSAGFPRNGKCKFIRRHLALEPGLARPKHAERKAASVFKWLNGCGDFEHRVTNGRQSVIAIGGRKQFRFHQACPVRECEKLHRLTSDLVVRALLDYESAGDHG